MNNEQMPPKNLLPCCNSLNCTPDEDALVERDSMVLERYLRILVDYKASMLHMWWIAMLVIVSTSYLMTPIYKSTALLYLWPLNKQYESPPTPSDLIEKESDAPEVLAAKIAVKSSIESAAIARDISAMRDLYKIQIEFLKSRSTIGDVIRDLKLDSNPIFMSKNLSFFSTIGMWIDDLLGVSNKKRYAKIRQYERIKFFSESLLVGTLKDSNLVYLSFSHNDPYLAHQIVEHMVGRLVDFTNTKYGIDNVRIVESSAVEFKPDKPDIIKNVTTGFISIFIVNIFLIAFLVRFDNKIRFIDDIYSIFGLSLLGIIPDTKKSSKRNKTNLLVDMDLQTDILEAYLLIRTRLSPPNSDNVPKVVHVTSAVAGEGKTFSAVRIAIAFAQIGKKVLLIDSNLRQPNLHEVLTLDNNTGLTDCLTGAVTCAEIVKESTIANLAVVTSGSRLENSANLLASKAMQDLLQQATQNFDLLILDGPPILDLADTLILAKLSEGTIMIVDTQNGTRKAIQRALESLRAVQVHIIGAIINRCKSDRNGNICY